MKYLDKDATIGYLSTRWPRWFFRPHVDKVATFEVSCPQPSVHDDIHGLSYTLSVVDPIDEALLLRALLKVPSFFSIIRVEYNPSQVTWYTTGAWKGWPMPVAENHIVVVDGDKRGLQYNGGTVGSRCAVAMRGGDTPRELGVRIWHELIHTLRLPADDMLVDEAFVDWLPAPIRLMFVESKMALQHDPQMQMLYYMYLMETM